MYYPHIISTYLISILCGCKENTDKNCPSLNNNILIIDYGKKRTLAVTLLTKHAALLLILTLDFQSPTTNNKTIWSDKGQFPFLDASFLSWMPVSWSICQGVDLQVSAIIWFIFNLA